MLSGPQNDVLYADGSKIGITIRSLSASGIINGELYEHIVLNRECLRPQVFLIVTVYKWN